MITLNKLLACAMALVVPLCTWAQTEIEPNNGSGSATAVTYNTAVTGSTGACAPTDNSVDYFSFTPPSQGQLRVQSSMSNTGPTELEVTFQVRQASTAVIGTFTLTAGANGAPVNDSFLFPCQGSGLYYISIVNPGGAVCTNYSFTYDIVAPVFGADAEPNSGSGDATTVAVGVWHEGQIDFRHGDNSDYYRIDLPTNGVLNIEWEAEHAGTTVPATALLSLRQTSTASIQSWNLPVGANSTAASQTVSIDCRSNSGFYYLSLTTGICGTSYRFRYTVTPPLFTNDTEPNNSTGQATTVPYNTPAEGQINFSTYVDNIEYYRIDLPTNGVLNIHWEAEHAGTDAAATVTATLRETSTFAITSWNLPVGANSTASSQTVSINCRSNSNFYYLSLASNICGVSYRISYTVTPPVFANDAEPNNGTGSAIALAPNTDTEGQINFLSYGDNVEYYRIDLPTQGVLNIHWEAENAGPSAAGTVAATLRVNTTADIITWNLPVGANSVATSQTVSIDCRSNTDFYYLTLASNICGVSYRFSYTVTPPVFANDVEPNNASGSATLLAPNTDTEGQINFSTYVENSDYYRLDLPTNGVLNIHWEAEHAGTGGPGTAQLELRRSTTALQQTWNVPVGGSSIPISQIVNTPCIGSSEYYYLAVSSTTCGVSYKLSYNVTPPVFGINPVAGTGTGNAPTIDLEAASVTGQLNFISGPTIAYYRIEHAGGPLVLNLLAEHPSNSVQGYNVRLLASSSALLSTVTPLAGANANPVAGIADFGTRAAATYFIQLDGSPCGLSYSILCNDADDDGVCNSFDLCAGTPNGEGVNNDGCSCSQVVIDDNNVCTLDACLNGNVTNIFQDADADLTCDANDGCPNDPNKIAPGQCGCGVADTDTDTDGTADCNDGCPADPNKIAPGICGCGVADTDTDTDGTADCNDGCPADPNKIAPGICGCGVADTDTDTDGTADCNDGCPADPNKIAPGICGCGVADTDTDTDGTADCNDGCPADPNKIAPGICGCGVADTDTDTDGIADCNDGCPADPNKIAPGICGCGVADTDTDGDGTADCNDPCPLLPNLVNGASCDDSNPLTVNDVVTNCICAGTLLGNDCAGVPGGPAQPGTACNDNNVCTTGDVYDTNCTCAGTFADADADGTCDANDLCPAGPEPGTVCNDNDACTTGDVIGSNCLCAGTFADADADGTCDANDLCPAGPEPGTACNDNDACTTGDVIGSNCLCAGTFADADADGTCDANDLCPVGPEPGTVCNDNDANTINDVIDGSCQCVGTPIGGCTLNEVTLTLTTDNDGAQTSWEILPAGGGAAVCSGGGYASNSTITATCCLPDGCYDLRVLDSFGDGLNNGPTGGWVLRDANNERILDNNGDGIFSGASAQAPDAFCLPLGTDRLTTATCDQETVTSAFVLQIVENPAVTAQFGVTNSTSGYQFWIYNPDGSYSRRVAFTHGAAGSSAPTGTPAALRSSFLRLSSLTTNPVPSFTLLNVRVRARVAGVYAPYGPACRMKVDPTANCQTTQLTTTADPVISCGATGLLLNGINQIHAITVPGANKYQFRFTRPGYVRNIATNSRSLVIAEWVTNPLQLGQCYDVVVRASFDNGGTWCAYGISCQVCMAPAPPTADLRDLEATETAALNMWPNPNRGEQLFITIDRLEADVTTATVDIFDLVGKKVSSRTIAVNGTTLNTVIDLDGSLSSGIYLVNLTAGEQTFTQRLVIQ